MTAIWGIMAIFSVRLIKPQKTRLRLLTLTLYSFGSSTDRLGPPLSYPDSIRSLGIPECFLFALEMRMDVGHL